MFYGVKESSCFVIRDHVYIMYAIEWFDRIDGEKKMDENMNEVAGEEVAVKLELETVKSSGRKETMELTVDEHNAMVKMTTSARIRYMYGLKIGKYADQYADNKYSCIANYLGIKVQYVRNVLVKK